MRNSLALSSRGTPRDLGVERFSTPRSLGVPRDDRERVSVSWLLAFAMVLVSLVTSLASAGPIRVLVVDGQSNHDWRATTAQVRAILGRSDRYVVSVATTPPEGTPAEKWSAFHPEFSKCDVVLLNYYGADWPVAVLDQLEAFVDRGGGLVAFHAGGSSFEDHASYNRMIGLAWGKKTRGIGLAFDTNGKAVRTEAGQGSDSGHGERSAFDIETRDSSHPIMRGLPAVWTHEIEELYYSLRGPAEEIDVLATALSPITKLHEPMVWTVRFGKGRVFVTALGHDVGAMSGVGFQTLLTRGCEWAATGGVTSAVPAMFPGKQPSRDTILANLDKKIHVSGTYAAVKLPITHGVPLHNPTAVAVGPGRRMYVANYTGEILRLEDSDGDGLEDTAVLYADVSKDGANYPNDDAKNFPEIPQGKGLRYPTAIAFKGDDCYVATTQEIRVYRDTNGDGVADSSRTFATGWPFTSHYFDWTFGLRFGPDGFLYTVLCTDYLNKNPAPDPKGLRGSLLRISPDGKTIERFAYGLRYAYGLAFNDHGDLFFSDNEGGGNPTEEINHAVRGGNYGHHPKLADSAAIEPVIRLTPHTSTDGIDFNPAGNDFGGTAGDLFVACFGPDGQWDKGGIVRVRMTRRADGSYEAHDFPFADGPGKSVDLRFGPNGDLYLAHFGREANGHAPLPTPQGDVYRFIYTPWLKTEQLAGPNPLRRKRVGDAEMGKLLAVQRGCVTCHSTDGSNQMLGPDLTYAFGTLGREGVLESIREPSKSIKTGYEPHELITNSGDCQLGRLVSADEKEVTLQTVMKTPIVVPRERIKSLRVLTQSLMPTNLLVGLSDAQVNDLLAYLQSLGQRGPALVRVNVGGEAVTDSGGKTWEADRTYSPGGYGAIGGMIFSDGSLPDPLVRSCRFGDFSYALDVDEGEYDVTLVLGEPFFHEVGQRVFSVDLQGKTVMENLDLVASPGFGKAITKTFRVAAKDGAIRLGFHASVNSPLLSGIEVRPVVMNSAAR
jgi:putative heme-binding domain-containing protein